MPTIDLNYGRTSIPLEYDATRFEILGKTSHSSPLSDVEIGERLDQPIDSLSWPRMRAS